MKIKQAHASPVRPTLAAALLSAIMICLSWTVNAAETRYQVDLAERAMQQVTI